MSTTTTTEPRRLVRRRDDRMVAGVCSGLAEHLGMDATLMRIIAVAAVVLTGGAALVAYLAAWILMPQA
jgi:phage shock protein PspC (stress-responsive transcriptional regulator)